MSIQWFPGHMNKARRAIVDAMPAHDVVIEVLDARMPSSSANPVITEIRRGKPCLKILNKSDLADEGVTRAWLSYFAQSSGGEVLALAVRSDRRSETKKSIPEACARLAPHRGGVGKSLRAMIVGIPNVGKSTLINTLMDRKVARVGDEPAVTKSQQRVVLKGGMLLSDNPGILWPKIDDLDSTLRLALGGALPDTVLDYEPVALCAVELLQRRYPEAISSRYKVDPEGLTPVALLEEIGRRRGCLRAGGVVDTHKAADVVIHDFRSGALGRITLDEPPVMVASEPAPAL